MKKVSFTSVCDFQGGTQPPKEEWETNYKPGYIRMLQIRDFTQKKESHIEYVRISNRLKTCNTNDILIGRYGASIGKILTGLEGAYNVAIIKTIPDETALSKPYLYYILKDVSFQSFISNIGSRAAQAGFNKEDLSNFQISLPPLDDQIRIATILTRAEKLIAKRKESIKALDELLKSTFLEMFGDPAKNGKGWERVTIRDLIKEAKYGTSKSAEGGNFKYLRMNNITNEGYWDFSNLKYIEIEETEKEKYALRRNDLVFNRTNSKELVGKTAVYCSDEEVIIAGYLIRVRTKIDVNPWYIWGYLNSKAGKLRLFNLCRNIVGMANINAQELQDIPILKPPIDLQNQFADIVEKVESLKARYNQSLTDLENLYDSLSQRAFKGALDLSKVSVEKEKRAIELQEERMAAASMTGELSASKNIM